MILVGIIDDDQMIREAITEYINSRDDMACIISRESFESFWATLNDENVPEIIFMDIGLPGMSGISGTKLVKDKYPEINIIMLTIYHDWHKIFQSLCAGASGYLLKNVPFKELEQAIKIVKQGGSFMSPQIARKVMEFFHEGLDTRKKDPSVLTGKEKEIVLALVDGLTYKNIADRFFISMETVRSHIKNIYKKLHVHSKAEVIRKSLSGEI